MATNPIVILVGVGETDAYYEIRSGINLLGRNVEALNCRNKKVSREHAHIELDQEGKVWLIPKHINPCFLHKVLPQCYDTLKMGQRARLNDGDMFSLLPDQYLYKVSIKNSTQPAKLADNYVDLHLVDKMMMMTTTDT